MAVDRTAHFMSTLGELRYQATGRRVRALRDGVLVADTDNAVQAATELGATVVIGPTDSPFGRMSLLLGTRQERFVLLDPRTVSDTLTDPTAR